MAQVLCPVVVGRDSELAQLGSAVRDVAAGRGGCVAITGEPGIGKSRLSREACRCAGEHGLAVIAGRAVPASTGTPYHPLTEALLAGLHASPVALDDSDLAPWGPALRAVLPGVVDAGRTGPDNAPPVDQSAPAVRGEAVLQLLRRMAGTGLVVILEDLHWADLDTLSVVEYLGDHLAAEPILCVVTVRSEPRSPALELVRRQRGRAGVVHLPLDRLDRLDIARIVNTCSPGTGPDVVRRVQEAADGIPLLAEDLLASPGLPGSFADTVRERLAELTPDERLVLASAAVLGRQFDWELLPAVTGQPPAIAHRALAAGVESSLLASDGTTFRFRHALTREAVLAEVLPPEQRSIAAAALAAVTAAQPSLTGPSRDLAADLAIRAGDPDRAGQLLSASGADALRQGALTTAADTLRRAAAVLDGEERAEALRRLIEALALAGRVDEAVDVGSQLVAEPEVHLRLAEAAVIAARWQLAREQLDAAEAFSNRLRPALAARHAVLEAELALAADDIPGACRKAEQALTTTTGADVRCRAFAILGRSRRLDDLHGARTAFEQGLAAAEAGGLPIWRLRALHELGTIDLFDHAGVRRLAEARATAERLGALSTAADIDLQLAAAYMMRWDLDAADRHGRAALEIAERIGLRQTRAKALSMLGINACKVPDAAATERYLTESLAAQPDDRMLEGFAWATRGLMGLLSGGPGDPRRPLAALEPFGRGMAILGRLPHAEPAAFRAVWPLLLASRHDRREAAALDEARRLGVAAIRANRALLGYAEAILAGRKGCPAEAEQLAADADRDFRNCLMWRELARLLAAPAALVDGWGHPEGWLPGAASAFRTHGLHCLAEACDQLLAEARPNPWAALGITDREAQVLRLLVDGLSNKEIAAELGVSPRTVEKHVENLLRKTGARSRTSLAVRVAGTPAT